MPIHYIDANIALKEARKFNIHDEKTDKGKAELIKLAIEHTASSGAPQMHTIPTLKALVENNRKLFSHEQLDFFTKNRVNIKSCLDIEALDAIIKGCSVEGVENFISLFATPVNTILTDALCSAVVHDRKDVLEFLVSKDVDLNLLGNHGTPLSCAVSRKNMDMVQFLLENKADPEVRLHRLSDNSWSTAITIANKAGDTKMVDLLKGENILNGGVSESAAAGACSLPSGHAAASPSETPLPQLASVCENPSAAAYVDTLGNDVINLGTEG